jgi:hypothetical protein
MFAKILHNDSVYYSPVFAVSMKYSNNKAVVFDDSFTKLIVVDIFRNNQYTTFFMNYDTEDFSINEDGFKSYWNDRNIFKTVKSKKYSSEMLAEAKDVLSRSRQQEFTEIKTSFDLDTLAINSGSFHDGYILGMQEKNGILEILLDTSWGALIILKCQGIIENSLRIGSVFCWCNMRKDDGFIEFSFEPMSRENEEVLKAKQVEFKPLFEKRINRNEFEHSFSNDNLLLKNKSVWIEIDNSNNDVLDFKERNILGYLENKDEIHRCFVFRGDIVYSFFKFNSNINRSKRTTEKIQTFQEECEQKELYFDKYPFSDDEFEEYEYDYGELIYIHKYSTIHRWILMLKIMLPVMLANNGIWLAIQLFNPQMKWTIYFTMGLGVSLVVVLMFLISSLVGFIKDKKSGYIDSKRFEIYENGLKYNGYNVSFNVDYSNIAAIEYKKGIIVQTSWSKYRLHRFKDDKAAYELIKKQFDKSTNNSF